MKDSFPPGQSKAFVAPGANSASPFEQNPASAEPNPFLSVELTPAMDYIEKRDNTVSNAIASALTLPQDLPQEEPQPDPQPEGERITLFDANGNPVEIFASVVISGDLCPCCGQVVPENTQDLIEDDYQQRDSSGQQEDSSGALEPLQLDSSGQRESWQESF